MNFFHCIVLISLFCYVYIWRLYINFFLFHSLFRWLYFIVGCTCWTHVVQHDLDINELVVFFPSLSTSASNPIDEQVISLFVSIIALPTPPPVSSPFLCFHHLKWFFQTLFWTKLFHYNDDGDHLNGQKRTYGYTKGVDYTADTYTSNFTFFDWRYIVEWIIRYAAPLSQCFVCFEPFQI